MSFTDTNDLTRGLVAGWLTDQVGRGRQLTRWTAMGTVVGGFVLMIGAGGFVRGLGILLLMCGLIVLMSQLLVRRIAKLTVRRLAEPVSLGGKREQIDAVAADVGLPTSSLGIIRFVQQAQRPSGATDMDAMTVRLERDVIDGTPVKDVPAVDPGTARPELDC